MSSDPTSRTLLTLTGLALLAVCLWFIRDVLPPFLIAAALALLLDPLLGRMQRWGLPRALAVGLTFLAFLGLFFGAVAFVVPRLVSQVAELVGNIDDYGMRAEALVSAWLHRYEPTLRSLNLPPTLPDLWTEYQGQITGYLQVLLQHVFLALQASAARLGWALIIPIVTLYLLADLEKLKARIYHLLSARYRDVVVELAAKVGLVVAAYLRGLTMICLAYGLAVYLILAFGYRLPYALILGLLAGALYAVPYLGQLSVLAGACAVAWASGSNGGEILGVAVTLVFVGQVFDQWITPRVIGRQVGLHPVLGLFALMVGAQLFGLIGMVIAVPVAASIRVVLVELFPQLAEPIPPSSGNPDPPGECALPAEPSTPQPPEELTPPELVAS